MRNAKGGENRTQAQAQAACSDFSACVGWWWSCYSGGGAHTYLPATPAVGGGQAGRVDDMVVGDKVEDKDKDENRDRAEEEEKEADNVKEKEAKEEEANNEEKDGKENEGREDTVAAAAEAELELSR